MLVPFSFHQALLILGLTLGALLVSLFGTWWRLRNIRGPFWAKFTNLQRASWVSSGHAHLLYQEMHDKYGDIVRMGPNMVSISNPEAIPDVYPIRAGVPKSDFYAALRPYSRNAGPQESVFNTQNEQTHKLIKSPIASIFSLTNVVTFEPLLDGVLECLSTHIDRRFLDTGEVFNLGDWLQYFAFDVMGMMTFSKRYGFLDEGRDIDGRLDTIYKFMKNAAPMTQIPWLDRYLNKNRFVATFRRTPGLSILNYVAKVIRDRRDSVTNGKVFEVEIDNDVRGTSERDFLTRYIEIQESKIGVPEWAPSSWVFTNVIAGSDSVGTVMRTALYHLLSKRETLSKVLRELETADLSKPYPKWEEIRELPYLDACVQEAMRLHPSFALPLERVVPADGMTILGTYIPGGTIVGGNPYVNNRHKSTFGEDAETWRPERWLGVSHEHRKKLEQSMLTLGAGRRICLGRHVGIFEVKKLIAFLLVNYDMHVVCPEGLSTENVWIFRTEGFFARVDGRRSSE
ncbi:cytochrome P450 CYP4/CYP19/CYP26 subfamily protein [Xylariaceae sp. FL0662B]|nr:cytochrome P450 CYP4/CYP19/CYP26 subfamily protein [Xylariaceae sp. FL0662B]